MDDEAEAAKEAEERAAKKAAAAAAEAEKAAEEAEKAEKAKALWKKAVEKVDTRLLCVIGRRLARCEPFAVRIGRHQFDRVHGAQADAHLQGRAARRRQGAKQVHAQGGCGEARRQHRVELSKLGQRDPKMHPSQAYLPPASPSVCGGGARGGAAFLLSAHMQRGREMYTKLLISAGRRTADAGGSLENSDNACVWHWSVQGSVYGILPHHV